MRTRELIRMICQSNEVEILAGHVGSDHIHLLVSVPPHLSASKLVQYIKQDENMQQMWELWKILKDKEQEKQERINEYKKMFINE